MTATRRAPEINRYDARLGLGLGLGLCSTGSLADKADRERTGHDGVLLTSA